MDIVYLVLLILAAISFGIAASARSTKINLLPLGALFFTLALLVRAIERF